MTSSTRLAASSKALRKWAEIVADHRFARDFDAQPIELRGEEKGIGVHPVRGEQFRSDCDDFSFHFELTRKREAFHFPIEAEESAVRGQDRAMARQERKAHQAAAAEHEFGARHPEKFARCRGGPA